MATGQTAAGATRSATTLFWHRRSRREENSEKMATVSPSTPAATAALPLEVTREHFVDPTIWRRELDAVFGHSWQMVAHESEIPAPGDYVTRRLGNDNVIVARDENGELHVMVNACTHRGTLLCKADVGKTSHFRCGYHGWLFGNDGKLTGVPRKAYYGDALDIDHLGLVQGQIATFHGLVFATLDPDLCSLEEYLGDVAFYLGAILGRSAAGTTAPFGSLRYTHAGNWKLEADNFAGDGYHLAHAHRAGFEMGIMGSQAGPTEGVCIQFPGGHGLRAQRVVPAQGAPTPDPFEGYPADRTDEIRAQSTSDQVDFISPLSSAHGVVYPNTLFLHTSRHGGLDPDEPDVAMLQFRTLMPISPTETEVRMWLIAPADYPDEWKTASYKSMQRQHGPAAFFESDDFENFKRIDEAAAGITVEHHIASNFDLALTHHPFHAWFNGPGNVVGSDISEVNQRWFYRYYLEQLGGGQDNA